MVERSQNRSGRRRFVSIGRRFSKTLIVVVMPTFLGFASVAIYLNVSRTYEELDHHLNKILSLAQVSLVQPIWNLDQGTIDNFVAALFLDESVAYVEILDDTGKQMALQDREDWEGHPFSYFSESNRFSVGTRIVRHEDTAIATLQIALSRERIVETLIANVIGIVLVTALLILVVFLVSITVTRRYVSQPLQRLQDSATRIAKGDLDTPIDIVSEDEIGDLSRQFGTMRDSVKEGAALNLRK